MRFIDHGAVPRYLQGMPNELEREFGTWENMCKIEKRRRGRANYDLKQKAKRLRQDLAEIFGAITTDGDTRSQGKKRDWSKVVICAYCQIKTIETLEKATIDHYKPRKHGHGDRYQDLEFRWANLFYVCSLCNKQKDNHFPHSIGGYICPSDPDCADYFSFDFKTLAICVNPEIPNDRIRLRVKRTIREIGLNRTLVIGARFKIKLAIDDEIENVRGEIRSGNRDAKSVIQGLKKKYVGPTKEMSAFAASYLDHLENVIQHTRFDPRTT